jgi:hypothetical protein
MTSSVKDSSHLLQQQKQEKQEEKQRGQHGQQQRRLRVLLGITGSVASIKGPELAVRLVEEIEADVKIVLTQAGQNFWNKAAAYHPQYWDKLQDLLLLQSEGEPHNNTPICIYGKFFVCSCHDGNRPLHSQTRSNLYTTTCISIGMLITKED